MQIKALVFDVFGTVVDWRNSIARESEQILMPLVDGPIDWHAFADSWRAKYQPAMEKVRRGDMEWVKLDDLHRANLIDLLADYGIAGLTESQIDDLNFAWHRLDPWPDAVAGLARLKSRYIIATLSNGNVALIVNMAKRAGLPWDMVLGAEIAQAYKPMPEAYLRSVAVLSLAPEECMMVAAHNNDLVAANKLGFQTAFVARPTEYGPAQQQDLKADHNFNYVADSFLDLADQLGCD